MKRAAPSNPADFRAGFVAIVGRPNSGKSTLFNRLLGHKLAIVSDKPQTTRDRILGILNTPAAQLILLDGPGFVEEGRGLTARFREILSDCAQEADLLLLLDDISRRFDGEENRQLAALLRAAGKPLLVAINKIDLAPQHRLGERQQQLQASYPGCEICRISACRGEGVEALQDRLLQALPCHPPYYPSDALTELPERFFAAETIREKAFARLEEEIPYSLAVQILSFGEGEERIEIEADLIVEKESQKGIVIGRQGRMIKEIGQAARLELEKVYQRPVLLRLSVRLEKNWTKLPEKRREYGYE